MCDNKPKGTTYFNKRKYKHMSIKIAVAKYIVNEFFKEGDSILIDAGTSLYPIAEEIKKKAMNEPHETHYTIMTHNYEAFKILAEEETQETERANNKEANLNTFLAGGRYDSDLNALFGLQTTMAYDQFYPKVVLIGVSGIVADSGLFCHGNTEELEVKRKIIQKACIDRIIIADYTKLGSYDSLIFCNIEHVKRGSDRCILIINKPEKEKEEVIKEKYQKEIEKLRNNYEIEITEIDTDQILEEEKEETDTDRILEEEKEETDTDQI